MSGMSSIGNIPGLKDGWERATEAARQAGKAIGDAASATGKVIVEGANNAARIYGDAMRAQAEANAAAARALGDAATAAGRTAVEGAKTGARAYGDAMQAKAEADAAAAKAAAEAIETGGKAVVNANANAIAVAVTVAAKKLPLVEECLVERLQVRTKLANDGEMMGSDCPKTSTTEPKEGKKPNACRGSTKKLPKIIYTNGIKTSPEAACETMRKIAESRCAEVIGVYNATDEEGRGGGDIANASRTINGTLSDEAAKTLNELIQDRASRGEPITIFAHSEGGLNTQRALDIANEEMIRTRGSTYANAAMSRTTVASFGTAIFGWIPGPRYAQFTNTFDPVPQVIITAQMSNGSQYTAAPNTQRHVFSKPHLNPIESHSMDTTYLDYLNSKFPVKKGPNGSCC